MHSNKSCSIVKSDDDSVEKMESSEDVEDSKPAASTALDFAVTVMTSYFPN